MEGAVKARVAVVDDHPLFRQGVIMALRQQADFDVVGEAGDAATAIALAKAIAIDVAVVDILMPSVSGITLCSELYEIQPDCRVLGLSVIDDPGLIAEMLRARACGFALKSQPPSEIVDAVRQVLGGIRYLPAGVSRELIDVALAGTPTHPFQRLTKREREVFELVIRGHSNDQMATRLGISRRTVETHRQRVMNKLSAHSVAEMQRLAAIQGWSQ